LRKRKRLEEKRVGDAEDGRRGADAEGEGEDDEEGEAGAACEAAERGAKAGEYAVEQGTPPDRKLVEHVGFRG
jgi:hypothetical protein